jgi:hypothetical protein
VVGEEKGFHDDLFHAINQMRQGVEKNTQRMIYFGQTLQHEKVIRADKNFTFHLVCVCVLESKTFVPRHVVPHGLSEPLFLGRRRRRQNASRPNLESKMHRSYIVIIKSGHHHVTLITKKSIIKLILDGSASVKTKQEQKISQNDCPIISTRMIKIIANLMVPNQ